MTTDKPPIFQAYRCLLHWCDEVVAEVRLTATPESGQMIVAGDYQFKVSSVNKMPEGGPKDLDVDVILWL